MGISGTYQISWSANFGTLTNPAFRLDYSNNNGASWQNLAMPGPQTVSYSWNTNSFSDGTYRLQIYLLNNGNSVCFAERSVIINNAGGSGPRVQFIDPSSDGSTLSGDYRIQWTPINVDFNTMDIELSYSEDNGNTWNSLFTEQNDGTNYHNWETTAYPDGSNYALRLQVVQMTTTLFTTQRMNLEIRNEEEIDFSPGFEGIFTIISLCGMGMYFRKLKIYLY